MYEDIGSITLKGPYHIDKIINIHKIINILKEKFSFFAPLTSKSADLFERVRVRGSEK